jgi:hypothetical protein
MPEGNFRLRCEVGGPRPWSPPPVHTSVVYEHIWRPVLEPLAEG